LEDSYKRICGFVLDRTGCPTGGGKIISHRQINNSTGKVFLF
jgi:hypothetical protein